MTRKNIKLTLEQVKERMYEIDSDIKILDDVYVNGRTPLTFECSICEHVYKLDWRECFSRKRKCPNCTANGIKISRKEIQNLVSEYGYTVPLFIENNHRRGTVFKIRCQENHEYDTTYREFITREVNGKGSCKKCNLKRGVGDIRRNSEEKVLRDIEAWGYTVEDDFKYDTNDEYHNFLCQGGHVRRTTYANLQRIPDCPECSGYIYEHTEHTVADALQNLGLIYIDGYTDRFEDVRFQCSCGKIDKRIFTSLMQGAKCWECGGTKRRTFEEVQQMFFDKNCELLECKFTSIDIPMKQKCSCGEISYRSLTSFMRQPKCTFCQEVPMREKHYAWNPDISDEERQDKRMFPEYQKWRTEVYERDDYTCQCCGERGGKLNAHHKDGYRWCKERRIDVTNGVTLCDECHMFGDLAFHRLYGIKDNTEAQFDEWLLYRREVDELGQAN